MQCKIFGRIDIAVLDVFIIHHRQKTAVDFYAGFLCAMPLGKKRLADSHP